MTATLVFMFCVVAFAMPVIDNRSTTQEVAVAARRLLQAGDRIYHYHGFFHDFTYYSGHLVGLVHYQDELELQFLSPAERALRFIDDAEFRRQWAGTGRSFRGGADPRFGGAPVRSGVADPHPGDRPPPLSLSNQP